MLGYMNKIGLNWIEQSLKPRQTCSQVIVRKADWRYEQLQAQGSNRLSLFNAEL